MAGQQEFKDNVVVVTGAGAGIGRAIAEAFAAQGAHLGVIGRNEERLLSLQKELGAHGTKVLVFAADVADAADLESAAARIEEELGPVDIWVNNAMVSVFSPIREMTAEEFRRVTEVTYLGTVYGTLAALRRMLPRDRGTIIQVGSALAYRGIPLQAAYCAAKHAVQGFHDSLLTELLHDNSRVKVTMVQLSAHNTPQFDWVKSRLPHRGQPVPPIYQPEVAARAVLWAARHYRKEWIVGFPAWKAIFGDFFLRSVADRYLAKTGYRRQQTSEPRNPARPHNLFESVPGPFGAHGRFNKRARTTDPFFELTKHIPFTVILAGLFLWVVLLLVFLL